jgi:NADPH:quinone reductase-like Zn-dependent oxidoreductase
MWILVYGGSTSNGSAALQLAKAAGVSVLAVAGKQNHELSRQLGAAGTVDYKDSDWIADAASQLRGKRVVGAFHSIGTDSTTKAIAQVLRTARFDVLIMSTGFVPEGIKGGLAFGTDATKDSELTTALWTDFLPKALANGSFVPKPDYQVVGYALEDVQQAMDMQRRE